MIQQSSQPRPDRASAAEAHRDRLGDRLYAGGPIITLDPAHPGPDAVAVRGNRIVAVGSLADARAALGADAQTFDLGGRTLIPGLIDSHCHLVSSVRSHTLYVDGHVPPNRSIADLLARISERARRAPEQQWIIVHGSHFGARKFLERRYPTRSELDAIAPRHPVLILDGRHTYRVNSVALAMLGIDGPQSPALRPGFAVVDRATGELSGELKSVNHLFPDRRHTESEAFEYIRDVVPELWVARGFTSVQAFMDPLEFRACQTLAGLRRLPLRITAHIFDSAGRFGALDTAIAAGLATGLGNEWLRVGGAKLFVDGAFMSYTAASRAPYLDMACPCYRGLLKLEPAVLSDAVRRAHEASLQVCIHAMGDRAQELALDAIEAALLAHPRPDARHRIEHFGCDMGAPDLRARARELGVVPNMTTGWLYSYGDYVEEKLGTARLREFMALRSILDAGLEPCNSSDQTGTEWLTLDPFFSIWCAVRRKTFNGQVLTPEQAISVEEALRMFTTNAARASFEEGIKGSVTPGKLADFTILDRNPLTIDPDELRQVAVDETIIDGRSAYRRPVLEMQR
ncbi:MAG: amidohydrolase [Lautropia sp.]